MVFGDSVVWADTMRWWAPAGALLSMWPVSRGIVSMGGKYLERKKSIFRAPTLPTLYGAVGLWLFLVFSIIMGVILPFTRRSEKIHHVLQDIASWTWTLCALACWIVAIGYARSKALACATAVTWFLAVSFAVLATK